MAVPAHLTIAVDELPFESLLSDWRWLVQPSFTPILMTAFGDLFLRDQTGSIHFLDLMSGSFKKIAVSEEEFERLCDEKERRRSWFIGFIVMELREALGNLGAGECYGCKTPLSLGGQLEADNFERTDLEVHYSILGQLHRQTKDLPPGTKINSINIVPPADDRKPKRWWQKLI